MTRLLVPLAAALALLADPAGAQSPQPAKPKPQRAGLSHELITQK